MKYIVTSIKRWGGEIQGKADDEGYFMHSLTLQGHTGEPIDYKSKTMPKIGDSIEGELIEYTSQAGNDRVRLETPELKRKDDLKQATIVAQFALRLAVEHVVDPWDKDKVMDTARYFIQCVNELVGEV